MRVLALMRGIPASGKSTWIKNMGLSEYTLSADSLRLMASSPILLPKITPKVTTFQVPILRVGLINKMISKCGDCFLLSLKYA